MPPPKMDVRCYQTMIQTNTLDSWEGHVVSRVCLSLTRNHQNIILNINSFDPFDPQIHWRHGRRTPKKPHKTTLSPWRCDSLNDVKVCLKCHFSIVTHIHSNKVLQSRRFQFYASLFKLVSKQHGAYSHFERECFNPMVLRKPNSHGARVDRSPIYQYMSCRQRSFKSSI